LEFEGSLCLAALWPTGSPILLPKVDYVLMGRLISGEKQYGVAPWAEVLDVVRRAGFETENEPLDLRYFRTPDPIAEFFAEMTPIDLNTIPRPSLYEIIDSEVVDAAARMQTEEVDTSQWDTS
jgi:hypothetical protein